MGNRFLLDCTLRDGGYVNDWEFGHDKIIEIFERLVSSGVDYIEVGFLDDRRPFDINRTIMPDTQAVNKIFAGLDKGNAMILGMIDYGTCSIDHIQPCKDTFLDGIRVIFKEHLMYEALAYCKQLKDLGIKYLHRWYQLQHILMRNSKNMPNWLILSCHMPIRWWIHMVCWMRTILCISSAF